MADFRIETDSLGEIEVPAGALWGAQTQRAVHNFPVSGMRPYPAFIWAQAAIKRAAAEVNHGLGLFKTGRQATGRLAATRSRRPSCRPRTRCWPGSGTISSWSIRSRPGRAPATT